MSLYFNNRLNFQEYPVVNNLILHRVLDEVLFHFFLKEHLEVEFFSISGS